MDTNTPYKLPELSYSYNALEPYIDEQTMKLHHTKHHAAYVNGANAAISKLAEARKIGDVTAIKSLLSSLSFNLSGHVLHSAYWKSMGNPNTNSPISGWIKEELERNFGSVEALLKEFTAAAIGVEGSGWAALMLDPLTKILLVTQIEKHNLMGIQGSTPILVLDVWEHAYYLKYQNNRKTYVESFEKLIDWKQVEKELTDKTSNNHI